MQRTFELFQQLLDVVERDARRDASEIPSLDGEPLAAAASRLGLEAAAQRFVDHVTEGPSRLPRPRLQSGRHVGIQRQRRPHIMMLVIEHHDVNRPPMPPAPTSDRRTDGPSLVPDAMVSALTDVSPACYE